MFRTAGLLATLALVISACSQAPADVAVPTLGPQFGTADDDYGADVVAAPAGGVYALSGQSGHLDNGEYDKVLLRRFDTSGKALWTREVSSYDCDYDRDYECGNKFRFAGALHTDARGYTYALDGFRYIAGDEAYVRDYSITKVDAAGNIIKKFKVGTTGEYFDGVEDLNDFLSTAVDRDGNVYVAKAQFNFSFAFEETTRANVVAKYGTNGALLWQRPSSVGTPKGVAVSSAGNVFIVGSAGVSKYTSSGTLLWTRSGAGDDVTVSGSYVYVRQGAALRQYTGNNGQPGWSKTQTGLSSPVFADLTGDGGGNVYLTGKYNASSTNRNVFTRKLNSSGTVLFTKTFGTSAYDDARGVATNGTDIYLTGATKGALAHPFRGGDTDGYVRKLNASGNPIWTR